MTSLLNAALAAAVRGWAVFPIAPETKVARVAWGTEATADIEQVIRWWTRWPTSNVGIATKPSGLVVLDTDSVKPGQEVPEKWAKQGVEHGDDAVSLLAEKHGGSDTTWADTYTVGTPSGGFHRYYSAPSWITIGNSQGRVAWKVDFRGGGQGCGGIVVAAGSRKGDSEYRVVVDRPVAVMPAWLAVLAAAPPPVQRPSTHYASGGTGDGRVPERLLAWLAQVPQGEHGSGVYWASCEARDAGVPEGLAVQELLAVAQRWTSSKPWTERRVATAVRSAYSRGRRA